MSITVYGIPGCDTVKKARAWLAERGTDYTFHDYKRAGITPDRLRAWCAAVGWERLLNRKGTTFRALEPEQKEGIDEEAAIRLMSAQPSMIKRPVVEHAGGLLVGFAPDEWDAAHL